MNQMNPHMGYPAMYQAGGHAQTPLYSYLNHHTHNMPNNYMMYSQQHNRY
jgi:hypothetical protein